MSARKGFESDEGGVFGEAVATWERGEEAEETREEGWGRRGNAAKEEEEEGRWRGVR